MSFYAAMLLLIGVAGALVGVCALIAWLEKKFPQKKFDERQQTVQGKAYKWATMVGFGYFAIIALLDLVLPSGVQADLFLLIMTGLALEAFVCACYCCFHDAYIPLTSSPKANIILFYLMGVINLINAVSRVDAMSIILTDDHIGKMEFGEVVLGTMGDSAIVWGLLMVSVMMIYVATMELVRYMRNKME